MGGLIRILIIGAESLNHGVRMVDALQELDEKLALESTFIRELTSLFARIAKDLRIQYGTTGIVPDASIYRADFEAALRKHYARVQTRFRGKVDPDKLLDDELDVLFLEFRNSQAAIEAGFITETNTRQLQAAVSDARSMLAAEDTFDIRSVALTAVVLFRRRYKPRIDTIALTETQTAAEGAKHTEAGVSARVKDRDGFKEWVTVGDDRVRPTHQRANGQRRDIDVPFDVGQSQMQFPTDNSLGARIEERINCRCSADYQFRGR